MNHFSAHQYVAALHADRFDLNHKKNEDLVKVLQAHYPAPGRAAKYG